MLLKLCSVQDLNGPASTPLARVEYSDHRVTLHEAEAVSTLWPMECRFDLRHFRRTGIREIIIEVKTMDWFETLTGFKETEYAETRDRLRIEGGRLISLVNGASYAIGQLELVSLQTLRGRMQTDNGAAGNLKVSVVTGDVRRLHRSVESVGALFQVASQFNLLQMASSTISPEQGVTGYQHDHTQGPACAIACGAATIYRNYFVPVGNGQGQTARRQLDGLADIGTALSRALARPVDALWTMQNGYALASRDGLNAISEHLGKLSSDQLDELRGQVRIGVLSDAEVTEAAPPDRPLVSQAFCSALPLAYTNVPADVWAPFAQLVLEAAYEATLRAAVHNAQRGSSKVVFLTLLGGGVFGNRTSWISPFERMSNCINLHMPVRGEASPTFVLQARVPLETAAPSCEA